MPHARAHDTQMRAARALGTCDVEDVAQAAGGADVDDERRPLRLRGGEDPSNGSIRMGIEDPEDGAMSQEWSMHRREESNMSEEMKMRRISRPCTRGGAPSWS
jgi:hypothetical protein